MNNNYMGDTLEGLLEEVEQMERGMRLAAAPLATAYEKSVDGGGAADGSILMTPAAGSELNETLAPALPVNSCLIDIEEAHEHCVATDPVAGAGVVEPVASKRQGRLLFTLKNFVILALLVAGAGYFIGQTFSENSSSEGRKPVLSRHAGKVAVTTPALMPIAPILKPVSSATVKAAVAQPVVEPPAAPLVKAITAPKVALSATPKPHRKQREVARSSYPVENSAHQELAQQLAPETAKKPKLNIVQSDAEGKSKGDAELERLKNARELN